jgi:CO/xanthine dehydrogenase Mo-binding subunit
MLTGIPQSDIRAIPAEIGGGFGGKTIVYLEPLATMLAKKSGRPVKMVMTREEVMRATGPTSGSKSTVKIGATKDGKNRRRARHLLSAGRRLPGLADPRRRGLQLHALRHPEPALRGF